MARTFPGAASNHLDAGDKIKVVTNTMTVACWMKVPDLVAANRGLFCKASSAVSQKQYELMYRAGVNAGKVSFRIGDATDLDDVISASLATANVWQHWCGVKDGVAGSSLRIYLNGVLDASATSARTVQNSTFATMIGNRAANDAPMLGALADAAIWEAALTVEEIQALARGVRPTMIRPVRLRGYYPVLGTGTTEPNFGPELANAALVGSAPFDSGPGAGRWSTYTG